MDLIIRRAQPIDIPALLDLLVQVNAVHADGRPDLFARTTKYSAQELEALLADKNRPVWVAAAEEDPERLVGSCYTVIQDHRPDRLMQDFKTLYIDDLCVDEGARGMHVGTALYEFVRDWARDKGFYNLTLNVGVQSRCACVLRGHGPGAPEDLPRADPIVTARRNAMCWNAAYGNDAAGAL